MKLNVGKKLKKRSILGIVLFLILAYLAPFIVQGDLYYIDILVRSTVYMTLALSLSLVIGQLGMLSLFHPAFFGIGAYTSALLSVNLGTPVLFSIFLGGIVAGFIAFLVSFPLTRLSYHSFGIGTLAFLMIAYILALRWVGLTGGAGGMPGLERPNLFSSDISQYYLILIIACVTIVCMYLLINSRIGRALRAIRENETLAKSMGVNPYKYKIQILTLAAAFAGFGGAFFVHYLSIVHPIIMDFWLNIYLLVILLVISPTNLGAIIVSSYLFTFLPEVLRVGKEIRYLAYGLILMILVIYIHKIYEMKNLSKIFTKLRRFKNLVW